jgi:hypothetical protein
MHSVVEGGGAEIQELDQAQNDTDWKALLNGQVSLMWKEIQRKCFIHLGKQNPGEYWVRMLIQKL